MAEASAKLTKNIGVVVSTTGPGAMNALSGLMESWVDSTPVLVISGQEERIKIRKRTRSFGTQGLDIVECAKTITKYSVTVREANEIEYHLEKAYYLATTGRKGPVWIDIPNDIQNEDIDENELVRFKKPTANSKRDKTVDLNLLTKALSKSLRPLIAIGQGVLNNSGDKYTNNINTYVEE